MLNFRFAATDGVILMASFADRILPRNELPHRRLRFELLEGRALLAGDVMSNHVPIAENDHYTLQQDTPLSVLAAGVLANDIDLDHDSLSVVLEVGPNHGTLSLDADGSFNYSPNAGFSGSDSFTYRVSDGHATSGHSASVSLSVLPKATHAPVGQNDHYTILQDSVLIISASGILANDTDLDYDNLTAEIAIAPEHGTLTLDLDGSFTYMPTEGFSGSDSFTYRVSDGVHHSVATVAIHVESFEHKHDFVPGSDQHVSDDSGTQEVPHWTTPVPTHPADEASGAHSYVVATDNDHLFAIPPAVDPTGRLTFAPAANANGSATVTVAMSDETGIDESSVHSFVITVTKLHALHNSLNALDVNGDDHVVPLDALLVINHLNAAAHAEGEAISFGDAVDTFLDVSGDDAISPIDALLVINALNSQQASQGEAGTTITDDFADAKAGTTTDIIVALAIDAVEQAARRRRAL